MHLLSLEDRKDSSDRAFEGKKTSTIEAGLVTAKPRESCGSKKGSPIRMAELKEYFLRKIEGGPGIAVYSPQGLDAEKDFQISQQVRVLVDHRDISDLGGQFDDAVNQLLFRSHSGDQEAAKLLIKKLESAIFGLKQLTEKQFSTLREIAGKSSRWPVMLSLKTPDILSVKRQLTGLKLGAHAAAPLLPIQRIDTESFWFQLAKQACEVCEFNRNVVPYFQLCATGWRAKIKSCMYWDRRVNSTFYYHPNGRDVIVIADWQSRCTSLLPEIHEENFNAWWETIVDCVLEYWRSHPVKYQSALRQIGYPRKTEKGRRNLAIKRLRRAFRGVIGLQPSK